MCFAMPLRSLDSFLWLKRTLCLRHVARIRFAAACLSLATPPLCERKVKPMTAVPTAVDVSYGREADYGLLRVRLTLAAVNAAMGFRANGRGKSATGAT